MTDGDASDTKRTCALHPNGCDEAEMLAPMQVLRRANEILKNENKRYREALEEIVDWDLESASDQVERDQRIAMEALNPKEKP